MKNIVDFLFGPLSKNWCIYFYFLSIIWYVFFLISIIYIVMYIFSKKTNNSVTLGMVIYSITLLLMYIEKRILHGMCINSSDPSKNVENNK